MSKKISLGAAISFMAVVAAVTFTITMIFSMGIFNQKVLNVKEREEMYNKIAEVDQLVRQNYVGEIDEKTLMDSISEGYVSGIQDRYAAYYSVESTNTSDMISSGQLIGIGASVNADASGYLRVTSVYSDSPASAAGLQKNDLILKIDDQDIRSLDFTKSRELLYGEAGTSVILTIRRDNADSQLEIVRKNYTVPVVSMTMMESNAYIRLYDFTPDSIATFKNTVDQAVADGATGIIFDLRGNTSGDLDSAAEMLDKLLPSGDIYSLTYKNQLTELKKTSDEDHVSLPMTVLVNSSTASAAELFAADLRDYNMAKLVGNTTAGKGVAQTKYTLKDGSSIYLSNAYFNPAVTENFNGTGLTPDHDVSLSADQQKSYDNGQLTEDSDAQLIKAVEVVNAMKK